MSRNHVPSRALRGGRAIAQPNKMMVGHNRRDTDILNKKLEDCFVDGRVSEKCHYLEVRACVCGEGHI